MKKLCGDFPFTWRLLLWTWRWLLGYLPMGRLLDVILVLSSYWLMVDVDLILKRRWLLGNNDDSPFAWCPFNTEFTLIYGWRLLDIKKTLTIGYLSLWFRWLSVYLTLFVLDKTLTSRLLADGPFTWRYFDIKSTLTNGWRWRWLDIKKTLTSR